MGEASIHKPGQLALSVAAVFPNRTWTFGLQEGAVWSGGVYRITFERGATPEDFRLFGSPPDDECDVEDAGGPCTLRECSPGLFRFGDTLGFKTEYGASEWNADARSFTVGHFSDVYVVESGEVFWGGVSSRIDRENLIVVPVTARISSL